MISNEIKRKVIAPLLILFIIVMLLIIFFNFQTLFGFNKVEYVKYINTGCTEKYINKVNVTPLCPERQKEIFVVTQVKNKSTVFDINYSIKNGTK
jgi:hypothetical protein